MKNRTVILAGGSGGLGASVVRFVASRGATPVIGCFQNPDRARKLADSVEAEYGLRVPVVVGNILHADVRKQLIETASSLGPLYGLVSLVGKSSRVAIEDATEEDLLDSTRSNFVAPVLIARDFAAAVRGNDASVVFISTMQAVGVFPGSTAYAAPKAALVHTARILARQWGGSDGIRVNVVAPGVTTSGMALESVKSGKYDKFIEQDVITRFGLAEDVTRAIGLFLETDNYLTGQLLTVDGGLTTRM